MNPGALAPHPMLLLTMVLIKGFVHVCVHTCVYAGNRN